MRWRPRVRLAADATLTIDAGSVDQVPPGVPGGIHGSAVEIRSTGGDILTLAASTSLGVKGLSDVRARDGSADPLIVARDADASTESGHRWSTQAQFRSLSSMFPSVSSREPPAQNLRPGDPMARGRHVKHARSAAFVVAIALGIVLLALGGFRSRHTATTKPAPTGSFRVCRSPARTWGHDAGRSHRRLSNVPRRSGSHRR